MRLLQTQLMEWSALLGSIRTLAESVAGATPQDMSLRTLKGALLLPSLPARPRIRAAAGDVPLPDSAGLQRVRLTEQRQMSPVAGQLSITVAAEPGLVIRHDALHAACRLTDDLGPKAARHRQGPQPGLGPKHIGRQRLCV